MNSYLFSNDGAMTFPHRVWLDIDTSVSGNEKDTEGVCFICGMDCEPGEPMIIISRLWKSGEEEIDSIVSLQACLSCAHIASSDISKWAYKPKLTRPEKMGFRFYSQSVLQSLDLSGSLQSAWRESVAPDSCADMPRYPLVLQVDDLLGGRTGDSRLEIVSDVQCHYCHRMVDTQQPHMEMRIALETLTAPTIINHDSLRLGLYCNSCSKTLFPVDNPGFTSKLAEDMFER